MICLFDNDVILKLAMANLLDDTIEVLQTSPKDIYVLPTAKYKFGFSDASKGETRYGADVYKRIMEFLTSVNELNITGDLAEINVLNEIDGIDPGEAILFSATSQFKDYVLATGDKTSLRSLASMPECQHIAERIQGHVICFELIIKLLIKQNGFAYVKSAIMLVRNHDTTCRAVFGSGENTTEKNVLEGLDSYINELRSLPINLLRHENI